VFNVRQIVRNNNATFYDFDTRESRSQKPRIIQTFIVAAFAAILCPEVSDNLLAGYLAVQSILLGFTVNVMFFLLGNRDKPTASPTSIEGELRVERLGTLYQELFYNVSYFNMLAVASIIVATVLLLPQPTVPSFMQGLPYVEAYVAWLRDSTTPDTIGDVVRGLAMFVFYAIAIEVVFSISRIIGRTSFYFERKMLEFSTPAD
jgi:hypothetical protein